MRQRLARKIMWWSMILVARIDDRECPKMLGHSFTFDPGYGIRFRDDGKGCPLMYLRDADYSRAHDEVEPAFKGGERVQSRPNPEFFGTVLDESERLPGWWHVQWHQPHPAFVGVHPAKDLQVQP